MSSVSRTAALVLATCLLALPARQVSAQTPTEAMAKFLGEWKYDQLDGGGECRMMGEYTLWCLTHWTESPGSQVQALWVMRWDQEAGVFISNRFYSWGYADSGLMWVDGDTFTTVYEGTGGARFRITQVFDGDTATYTWHTSLQGGAWEEGDKGSTTRVR